MIQIENKSWQNYIIKIIKDDDGLKLETSIHIKNSKDLINSLKYWLFEESNFSLQINGLQDLIKKTYTDNDVFFSKALDTAIEKKEILSWQNLKEFMNISKKYSMPQWEYLYNQFERTMEKGSFVESANNTNNPVLLSLISKFPLQIIKLETLPLNIYKLLILANCNSDSKSRIFCTEQMPDFGIKDTVGLIKHSPSIYFTNFLLERDKTKDYKILQIILGCHQTYNFQDLPIKQRFFLEKTDKKLEFFNEMSKYLEKNFLKKDTDFQRISLFMYDKKLDQDSKIHIFNTVKTKIKEAPEQYLILYKKTLEYSFGLKESNLFEYILNDFENNSYKNNVYAQELLNSWVIKGQERQLKKEFQQDISKNKIKIL